MPVLRQTVFIVCELNSEHGLFADDGMKKSPPWITSRFEFRLQLAGLELGRREFRCLVADASSPELSSDPDAYWPTWDDLSPDVDAVVVPFQPVKDQPARISRRVDSIRYFEALQTRGYIHIQDTFERYMAKFTAKKRHNLNRTLRTFAEVASDAQPWQEFKTVDEMSRFYDLAQEISRKSWQGKMGEGLPRNAEYRARVLERAASESARGYVLFFDKVPAAFIYLPVDGRSFQYEVIGYDPEFGQYSPGTVLFLHVLKHLFAERTLPILDLGRLADDSDFKSRFATDSIQCATAYFLRRRLRNEVTVRAHYGAELLVQGVRRVVRALGMGDAAARIVRRAGLSPVVASQPVSPDGRPQPMKP